MGVGITDDVVVICGRVNGRESSFKKMSQRGG